MNQKLFLFLLCFMFFFVGLGFARTYGPLTFTSDVSGPGAYGTPKEISSGVIFYIDITANYSKGPYDSNRQTWSSPFIFYGTHIANVTWGDTSTLATTTFKNYFDFYKIMYVESWNDGLPDKYNFTGIANNYGLPGGSTLAFHIPCKVTLTPGYTSGQICVDSADMDDDSYDWIFDDPSPSFNATCWTVRARTINLFGQIKITNYVTGENEPFPNLHFDVVTPADTANPVASGMTGATGNYSIPDVPAFNARIWLRFKSFQPPLLFSIYKCGSQDPVIGFYKTIYDATQNLRIDLAISPNTMTDPDAKFFFKTARMIKDLHTTDTIMSKYGISIDSLDIRTGDYTHGGCGTTGSCWFLWNGRPYIRLDSAQWDFQTASHEIGHQVLYQIQNYVASPSTAVYTSPDPFAITDTLYAFKEGFPDFIRVISSDPTVLKDSIFHESYESNNWWMGPNRNNPNKIGEIVPGSVTSMLLDLYDDSLTPRPRTNDDDSVKNPGFMMPKLLDCIRNYNHGTRTWSFPLFTYHLVQDPGTTWFIDSTFNQLREGICEIFIAHYHSPAQSHNYCLSSHGIEDAIAPVLPMEFSIAQNYPNPFNGGTCIVFTLPFAGDCNIEIFNVLGQKVWERAYGAIGPGRHVIFLNDRDIGALSSGVYFYKVSSNGRSISKKMLILK